MEETTIVRLPGAVRRASAIEQARSMGHTVDDLEWTGTSCCRYVECKTCGRTARVCDQGSSFDLTGDLTRTPCLSATERARRRLQAEPTTEGAGGDPAQSLEQRGEALLARLRLEMRRNGHVVGDDLGDWEDQGGGQIGADAACERCGRDGWGEEEEDGTRSWGDAADDERCVVEYIVTLRRTIEETATAWVEAESEEEAEEMALADADALDWEEARVISKPVVEEVEQERG